MSINDADTVRRDRTCFVDGSTVLRIYESNKTAYAELERLMLRRQSFFWVYITADSTVKYALDERGLDRGRTYASSLLRDRSSFSRDSARLSRIGYTVADLELLCRALIQAHALGFVHTPDPEVPEVRSLYIEAALISVDPGRALRNCVLGFGRYYRGDTAYAPIPARTTAVDGWGVALIRE